jgi:DNA-binding transcriptional LysR family regulator
VEVGVKCRHSMLPPNSVDFALGYIHNVGVMHKNDVALVNWARTKKKTLLTATFSQLVTLLELCGSESAAAMAERNGCSPNNYLQVIQRLEQALGVGPLTRIDKKSTQANQTALRIAAEARQLLQEIQAAEAGSDRELQTWIVGAGDAWLQSAIIPALSKLCQEHPKWRWEVRNLKAHDICTGLREGALHFGFARKEDAAHYTGLEASRPFDLSTYSITAGNASNAPKSPVDLVRWLIRENRPLVQQGSTWQYLSKTVGRILNQPKLLAEVEPQVTCESHTQAAVAALQSSTWCIVPAALSRLYSNAVVRVCQISAKHEVNEMAMVTYPRAIRRIPGGNCAQEEFRKAIGRTLQV